MKCFGYLLLDLKSFHGMPWKEGSLQEYLHARDTCGDFNPLVFSVMQVHSIGMIFFFFISLLLANTLKTFFTCLVHSFFGCILGILDIRLLNLDRNDGNILVTQRPLDTSPLERFMTPEGKISKYSVQINVRA
jgi:hypothetical protein